MGIDFNSLVDITNENLSLGVITVCLVCSFMLIANVARRNIRVFRRSLMPTAVIAGLLGLIIKEFVIKIWDVNLFSMITLSSMVYHLLPIGFIALCLRDKGNYSEEFDVGKVKSERVVATRSGALIISTYLLQGMIGIAITSSLGFTFMKNLNKGTGIMLALGFGQGPQQANATGYIWDAAHYMDAWGAGSARNFGLAIAAMGFLWASIGGIILVNRIAKKKGLIIKRNEYQKSGELSSYSIEEPNEVPLSESIDKFTLQICMVGGVYILTQAIIILIEIIFRASSVPFLIGLIPTFWGFSFMIAALVAIITKIFLRHLVKKGIMKRKYPNSYMMNRIAGASFDLTITAALFLVSVTTLGTLWIPVVIMSCIGGICTAIYLRYLCNYIYKDYKDEAFLAFYGMLTGTIANGMILLREIDNNFSTPAGDDLVIGSSAAIVLGIPMLLLIAQAPGEGKLWWVTGIIVLYFLILSIYQFKTSLFKKR
ncbi:MAG: hypothetical protein FWG98_05745 [Candidatus Cloacimonetes bacterium]|nr:hypothetical protein [Candidatus Cloacimonadota bacterium]